jgi:putative flippase GtrA
MAVRRIAMFAGVGAAGTVLNLLLMAALLAGDVNYLAAAWVATEITIGTNFLLHERLVFADLRGAGQHALARAVPVFVFNNVEFAVRAPLLVLAVEALGLHSLVVQAGLLGLSFLVRYVFSLRLVYRPQRSDDKSPVGGANRALAPT